MGLEAVEEWEIKPVQNSNLLARNIKYFLLHLPCENGDYRYLRGTVYPGLQECDSAFNRCNVCLKRCPQELVNFINMKTMMESL